MIRSVMNIKGGIGKTSTSIQLAAGFGKAGRKTLLVDADGQGTISMLLLPETDFNDEATDDGRTITGLLKDERPIQQCIWPTHMKNVDLIPANLELFNVIYELQSSAINGLPQLKLKKLLTGLDYDEIIIDNNPSISMMSVNSIYAAQQIIIPTNVDIGALAGVKNTLRHAASVVQALDSDADLDYKILLTMINRNKAEQEVAEKIQETYKGHTYCQCIRYQAAPFRRSNFGRKILIDDQKSKVALEYRNFICEVMGIPNEMEGDAQ